jgi:uncharacterized Fe-S cluster-containing MiaB family protein
VHLVGVIIRIYHDARSSERQKMLIILFYYTCYYSYIAAYCFTCGKSFSAASAKDTALHMFAIFATVCKRVYILHEGTEYYVTEVPPQT